MNIIELGRRICKAIRLINKPFHNAKLSAKAIKPYYADQLNAWLPPYRLYVIHYHLVYGSPPPPVYACLLGCLLFVDNYMPACTRACCFITLLMCM